MLLSVCPARLPSKQINGARIDSFWSNGKKKKSTFFGAVRRVLRGLFLFCFLRLVERKGGDFCCIWPRRHELVVFYSVFRDFCRRLRVEFYCRRMDCGRLSMFGSASSNLVGGRAWIGRILWRLFGRTGCRRRRLLRKAPSIKLGKDFVEQLFSMLPKEIKDCAGARRGGGMVSWVRASWR